MDTEAIKRKLRKLLTLAKRGVGGEAVAAERLLTMLMQKHGITIDDFAPENQEQTGCHNFAYANGWSKTLLTQIISKVLNVDRVSYWHCGRKIEIECTKAQAVEIQLMHEVYLSAFKKDLKNFEHAFIQRHGLFPNVAAKPSSLEKDSEEDMAAIISMMKSITPVSYRKALTRGKVRG